ncbi:Nucleolar protein 9 [Aphelenchoides fujianensis]|nr:Nucleolar protein 9 [Aphelenchoides fujianensis]
MTRKRKVAQEEGDDRSAAAGYKREFAEEKPAVSNGHRRPPPKGEAEAEGRADGKPHFPTELVRYLEQMAREEVDPEVADIFVEKCLEEVRDQEETLLHFCEGCFAIERIFLRSRTGAFEFLRRLERRKKSARLALIFNLSSGRTLEKLFYTLLVNSWIELILDNWQDVVFDRAASFVLRTLARVLIGVSSAFAEVRSTAAAIQRAGLSPKGVKAFAKPALQKLITRAFDYASMKDLLNVPSISLVLQDMAAVEKCAKTGRCRDFVVRFLSADDEQPKAEGGVATSSPLIRSWEQRDASRVWEALIGLLDEDLRETLFDTAAADEQRFLALATQPHANFPLQSLLKEATSETIAQEVATTLVPQFGQLLAEGRPWILPAALQCIRHHADLQSATMKTLRRQFGAKRQETRAHFLPNVLTLNNAEIREEEEGGELEFEVKNSQLVGSLILDQLFQFEAHQSLLVSLQRLAVETLRAMAEHPVASHLFDSIARSTTVDLEEKLKIFEQLDIAALVKNQYGSRVFESFWFELPFDADRRERIVRQHLMPLLNSKERNKFASILISKLKVGEFRENPKQWRARLPAALQEELKQRKRRKATEFHGGAKPPAAANGATDDGDHAAGAAAKKRRKKARKPHQ